MDPLVEDFSDVAEFVKEDNSSAEQNTSEDEVERKIDEEHAKFKEAQAKRQEEVRANRPWSAPPIESPRPEQQKEREKERRARESQSDASASLRSEYEPPARPYLPASQASGSNLSYLSRPQSAELRSQRPSNSGTRSHTAAVSPASLSGIEEEAVLDTAAGPRGASDMGRGSGGLSGPNGGAARDATPGRDQNRSPTLDLDDTLDDDGNEGEEEEDLLGESGGDAAAEEEEEERGSRRRWRAGEEEEEHGGEAEPSEEDVAEAEDSVGVGGGGGAGEEEGNAYGSETGRREGSEDGVLNATFEVRPREGGELEHQRSFNGDAGGTSVELDPQPWESADATGGDEEEEEGQREPRREEEEEGKEGKEGKHSAGLRQQGDGEEQREAQEQRWLTKEEAEEVVLAKELSERQPQEEAEQQQQEEEERHAEHSRRASEAARSGTDALAMRGFVEPLPYESSSYDTPHDGDGGPPALDAEPASLEIEGGHGMLSAPQESGVAGGESHAAEEEEEEEEEGEADGDQPGQSREDEALEESGGEDKEGDEEEEEEDAYDDSFESAPTDENEEEAKASLSESHEDGGAAVERSTRQAASPEPSEPKLPSAEPSQPPSPAAAAEQPQPQPPAFEVSQLAPAPEPSLPPPPPPEAERSSPSPPPPASEPSQSVKSPSPPPPPSSPPPPATETSSPHAPSVNASYMSTSLTSRQTSSLPPLHIATDGTPEGSPHASPPAPSTSSIAKSHLSGSLEAAEEEQVRRRAAAAAAAVNNLRTVVGGAGASGIGANASTASLPPPAGGYELLPPQQFAMQLLKHDIDVLPQHHRVAAEAAAARRKSSFARPAGAGLAAFGYLGFHVVQEELNAPSGPNFRNLSPGRTAPPGGPAVQHDGDDAAGDEDMDLMPPPPDLGLESEGGAGFGEQPIPVQHMRPGLEVVDIGGYGGREPGLPPLPSVHFMGTTHDERGGRMLPPVAPPQTSARSRRESSGGSGVGGGERPTAADSPPSEGSVSVLDDAELVAPPNRIKFDVWLDQLSGTSKGPSEPVSGAKQPGADGGGAGMLAAEDGGVQGRRPPRPMTAPASGRRRPASARPGMYGTNPQQPTANVSKPLGRPMSAQPHHLRPASASRRAVNGSTAAGNSASGGYDPPGGLLLAVDSPVPVTMPSPEQATAAGGTAAVAVAGVTVSVYVADTLKRIVEANRWLQHLGVTAKRYRLKDRMSNMTVQLCEDTPPSHALPPPEDAMYDTYDCGFNAGGTRVVRELTLKQFLAGHAKLKQQVKKLRQGSGPPPPPNGAHGTVMGVYGMTDIVGGGGKLHRPYSADAGVSGSAGASLGVGGRVRPASAMPYSGSRGAFGGADPTAYGNGTSNGGAAGGAYAAGRPARPNSASPAYGRAPLYTVNSGGSPPAGSGAAFASYSGGVKHPPGAPGAGMLPPPRSAWGTAAGGYPYHPNAAGGAAAGGVPYMHRSASATPRMPSAILDDEDAEEEPLVLEPDERGDISRAVRQHLGGAADYCQARRNEISRLRNMPFI